MYSGKTMLELLGGEAFFLTPPSTPTKLSPPVICKKIPPVVASQQSSHAPASSGSGAKAKTLCDAATATGQLVLSVFRDYVMHIIIHNYTSKIVGVDLVVPWRFAGVVLVLNMYMYVNVLLL